MYENPNKIVSTLFNSQSQFQQQNYSINIQNSNFSNCIIKRYEVLFKERISQKKLRLKFQSFEHETCQNDSILLMANSFMNNNEDYSEVISTLCYQFKVIQFDYLDFSKYQKDYSIDQWIALQIKQILIAISQQFQCKKIYLWGEINGACGIIEMLNSMNQTQKNQRRISSHRFSVLENQSLANSQIPQFCDSVVSQKQACQEVEKIQLDEFCVDEQLLLKFIKGVVLFQPYQDCKQYFSKELSKLSGIQFINNIILNLTVKMNYPNIFISNNLRDIRNINIPIVFLFRNNKDIKQNIKFFNECGSNIKKLRIIQKQNLSTQDIKYLKLFFKRIEQNFYIKKTKQKSFDMYGSKVWRNSNLIRQSDLYSCDNQTIDQSQLIENDEEKRETVFSNTDSLMSQVIFKNNNKNEMIRRVQQNGLPKKKRSYFGIQTKKNKIKENILNQL